MLHIEIFECLEKAFKIEDNNEVIKNLICRLEPGKKNAEKYLNEALKLSGENKEITKFIKNKLKELKEEEAKSALLTGDSAKDQDQRTWHAFTYCVSSLARRVSSSCV